MRMKKFLIVPALLAAALTGLLIWVVPEIPSMLTARAKGAFVKPPPPEKTLTRVEYFNFDPASRLEDRIKAMPPELFAYYRDWDKAPDYTRYEPAPEDKALIMEYFTLLPGVYRQVFEERCLGIYFIGGFKGNGVTSWADDKDGKVYFHVTLNPDSLKKDLSATLTEREASCFVPREGWEVKVNAGTRYKGLLYALLHEGAHGVDYVKGVTPWADDDMPAYLRPAADGKTAIFFRPFWRDFYVPEKGYDFPLRDKITFYGLGGGPKIDFADAPALYKGLEGAPFASLYGSKSWAEDFAELATLHVLAFKLKQPYTVTLTGPGTALKMAPMAREAVYQRAGLVMNDVDPGGGHISAGKASVPGMKELDARMKAADADLERARQLLEKPSGKKNSRN